ncbi:YraN family protein [Hymenobacter sp. GOD-10R]|uniref:YraN family protein n=1 Tax=Hymenobacter sp. GOD-10R TaxID=3093922 RepID=UPI002D7A38D7|nr:YraN family protein [Hymenobacter sp. GOD-10R]WRQ27932.1 YraN family protein [Hymenobacter sp. GOD-10R]
MPYDAHQLGHAGEAAAADYFLGRGFAIERQNYRYRRAEVDLIVRLATQLLVFVEVKTRSSSQFGYPETFVTDRKRQLFRLAAEQYQEEINWAGDIRFDILALTPTATGFKIEHFEDAFY